MPPFPPQILSNTIHLLRHLCNPQIHLHNQHPLLLPHLLDHADNRERHARQAQEVVSRAAGGIGEDNAAGVFKGARGEQRGEEEGLRGVVVLEGCGGGIVAGPCPC